MTLVSTLKLLMVKRSYPNGLAVLVISSIRGKTMNVDPEKHTLCFLQSNVQSNMLSPSVLPELTTRRKAWEQAHGLAAPSSAWLAEHSKAAAHSQPHPAAVGNDTAKAGTAPSTASAEALASELFTLDHSPPLISSSSLDNATAAEPATSHLQTPSIVQSRCKRYKRARMSSVSADKSNSRMLDLETGRVTDKGKKSAASVTDKHISEAPCLSHESTHSKQLGDQQENDCGVGGVKKLTGKVITVF